MVERILLCQHRSVYLRSRYMAYCIFDSDISLMPQAPRPVRRAGLLLFLHNWRSDILFLRGIEVFYRTSTYISLPLFPTATDFLSNPMCYSLNYHILSKVRIFV